LYGNPDDVLGDPTLSRDAKRSLLASWASDENSVADIPTLRQLPDGSIVKLELILNALKELDGDRDVGSLGKTARPWKRLPFPRQRMVRSWQRYEARRHDDDDPPPSPAYAARRPKDGGGAAFAVAGAIPA
jgi:hypothetical protein